MKAIQTSYKGFHFRSRLEARWAVFFDALSIEWEYEREGYLITTRDSKDVPYLPDFWLPKICVHVEVKGDSPSFTERQLCQGLHEDHGAPTLLVWGLPEYFPSQHTLYITDLTDSSGGYSEWDDCMWCICPEHRRFVLYPPPHRSDRTFYYSDFAQVWRPCECNKQEFLYCEEYILEAATAAKSARFEHGQKGAR